MNKIKILDFSPYYSPHIGGLEKYSEELHENLAKKNCQITVFAPRIPKSAKKEETRYNINIIRYPAFEIIFNYPLPKFWKREFYEQWKKINKIKFDVVFSAIRFFIQPLIALFFAKKHKIPYLHIEHCSNYVKNTFLISLISRIVDMTIGKFSLAHADLIIAVSRQTAKFIKKLSGKKSSVIYRGISLIEIDAISPCYDLQARLKDKMVITFAGRLIYGKGIIHLIEAIKNTNRKNIVLIIVGNGPERKKLQEYAQKNNLNENVMFYGEAPFQKVISILKISNIFVNPSYNEGLPTSILEAGACRLAIIATNVGGTSEIISDGQSGILIKPYSAKLLENALKKLLDNSELRAELGKNARKRIDDNFKWENATQIYMQKLYHLLKNNK